MKKEVLIVTHSLEIGGGERHVANIANYLAKNDVAVTVFAIDNDIVAYPLDKSIDFRCIADVKKQPVSLPDKAALKLSGFAGRSNYTEFKMYIKYSYTAAVREFAIAHTSAVVLSFMVIPIFTSLFALRGLKNRLVIFEFNNPDVQYNTAEKRRFLRKYIARADTGIFQTEDQKKYYSPFAMKKFVIPNPLFSAQLPDKFTGRRQKTIVNFCRLSRPKNLPLLIDAFLLFHGDCPEYRLAIYGDGDLRDSLLEYINSKNASDFITLYHSTTDIHNIVKDSAMFVSSSDWEGISNSMLEAMAIGLPVICTDCPAGGARMMIEDGVNGLLTPVGDSNAMYLAMKRLAENPVFAASLAENAVKIRDRLDPEKICGEIIKAVFCEDNL